jgi:hypothetical protein
MDARAFRRVVNLAVAGLVAAALVAVNPAAATAAVPPCQRTYAGGGAVIADNGAPTIVKVDLPEDGQVVTDVDVALDIHYPDPSDLHIEAQNWSDDELTIRANTLLFDREAGITGSDMLGTVFDDEATVPITWGDAPYSGRFMPRRPLTEVEGLAGGTFVLLIANFEAVPGTLDSWSFTISYASCDFDADGVEDHSDSCLGVNAHTATGCPLTTRAVTASYRKGAFKGALSSPVVGCKAGRAVTVWKVRKGPDRMIGTRTTAADGTYRLRRARHVGRYYATSARAVVSGTAECPAVRSATFRLR